MSERIRVAEINPADFEHGADCSQCHRALILDDELVAPGRRVYERRIQAAHVEDGEVVWIWELICKNCSAL